MADYDLYYWPVPFRGQFVRAVLAYAGRTWTEHDSDAIATLIDGPLGAMPVPFVGPPLLVDRRADFAIAQMPAIVLYLGETLGLSPATPALRASTLKIVADANDVIDELTLDGGRLMWTAPRWRKFVPWLRRWMTVWEETGRRHGLTADDGFMLGSDAPGLVDVVTATLWTTMADRFAPIAAILDDTAPLTAGLARRVAALPALAALAATAREDYGDDYCGGAIEASLRAVVSTPRDRQ